MTIPALIASLPAIALSGRCSSHIDCNMAGYCVAGACHCDIGWTGSSCELINFGQAERCGAGGLCLNNTEASTGEYSSRFTSSWGGEAVEGDDGNWHIYAAAFDQNAELRSWLTQSRVVHGISASGPQGPYNIHDIALGPRDTAIHWDGTTQHNPAVQRAPTGEYLLYYMGSSSNETDVSSSPRCHSWCADHHLNTTTCSQRVGLATSKIPNGPWTRLDRPILGAGPRNAWDDQFTTNPTPYVFPNGSALLIYKVLQSHPRPGPDSNPNPNPYPYPRPGRTLTCTLSFTRCTILSAMRPQPQTPSAKAKPQAPKPQPYLTPTYPPRKARSRENMNVMSTGVAFAKHWSGPYERATNHPIDVAPECEDAGIYFSSKMRVFRIILHCGCSYQSVWSTDGINWRRTAAPQPWCDVKYSDGTSERMTRRERPKWIIDKNGNPAALLTGVEPASSHSGRTFTMAQAIVAA